MWTNFLLGVGKLFQWSFQILPPIGNFMNWVYTIVGVILLVVWTLVLVRLGDGEDKRYEPKNKFPYF